MAFLICFIINFFVEEQYCRSVWKGNGYVVYEEYYGECHYGELALDPEEIEILENGFETKEVLYKRRGLLDKRLLDLHYVGFGERSLSWVFDLNGNNNPKISYTIFESFD